MATLPSSNRQASAAEGKEPASRAKRPSRWLIRAAILFAVAAIVVRAGTLEGLLIPLRAASGSMWPAFTGPHHSVRCRDCSFSFDCGTDASILAPTVTCPRCFARADAATYPDIAGQRLIIDRAAYWRRPPGRWEIVAFRCEDDASQYCLKRIVGLPGELVTIEDGDVHIDGRIATKPLATLRSMAVSVYRHPGQVPSDGLPGTRWQAEAPSAWRQRDVGFELASHHVRPDARRSADWLTYHHVRVGFDQSRQASPILDDVSYNQGESRELSAARDLLVRVQVTAVPGSRLLIRVDGPASAVVELDLSRRQGLLNYAGTLRARFPLAPWVLNPSSELEVAVVDGRFVLAIDREELLDTPLPRLPNEPPMGATPVAIGAARGRIRVTELEIFRDVQYLPPFPTAAKPGRLKSSEYYVLGDNSSISNDSRTHGPIEQKRILGRCISW